MKLNKSTLAQIPIHKPSYNRDEIGIGIVHFGVGGFHRAHQAMYVDRLLEMGLATQWGICGVGVLPADRKMADVMAAQDGLYTLLVENPDGSPDARVIGSIVDYRYAPDDPDAVIELLAAPSTRIVSLTITEGGYNTDNLGGIAGSAGGGGGVTGFRPVAEAKGGTAASPGSVWSPKQWRDGATAVSPRRRSCRATTSRATARSRGTRSRPT